MEDQKTTHSNQVCAHRIKWCLVLNVFSIVECLMKSTESKLVFSHDHKCSHLCICVLRASKKSHRFGECIASLTIIYSYSREIFDIIYQLASYAIAVPLTTHTFLSSANGDVHSISYENYHACK